MYSAVYESLGFLKAVVLKLFFFLSDWHNAKHVHVPISQYKMCVLTLGTVNMNAYLQATGLSECFAGWKV